MARLWSSGFELNAVTNATQDKEWHSLSIGQSTVTSPVHAGIYSLQVGSHNESLYHDFYASAQVGPIWARTYIYIQSYPNLQNNIFAISTTTGNDQASCALDQNGKLQLFTNNSGTAIGSLSNVLSLNTWYLLELKMDGSLPAGSQVVEGRINGVVWATSNTQTLVNVQRLYIGSGLNVEALNAGIWNFDDVAINDNTGSFQNSYPGPGGVIHLRPNASGDNNAFSVQVGGTAGSSNNYTRVNEVTPDDSTSYNADTLNGDIDDFNIDNTPSSIGYSDIINVVAVGVRYAGLSATADATFNVRVKKTSGGTVSQGSSLTPNSTSYTTNADSAPFNYSLTTYNDPDNNPWNKSTLDSAQIGYQISSTGVNAVAISTAWMLVDFTPLIWNELITPLQDLPREYLEKTEVIAY